MMLSVPSKHHLPWGRVLILFAFMPYLPESEGKLK
jgi:hypothetical protein